MGLHPDLFDSEATPVFNWNYADRKHRIKINQGGTSSGKTYSILQVIVLRLLEKSRIATVVGQDMPNLRKGSYRDFETRILPSSPAIQAEVAKHNKSTFSWEFKNGSILEFVSYGDAQDAKNGKRNIAFFNEGNGVPYSVFRQVTMRTSEEIFVDYNPTAPFWAHEHLMGRSDTIVYYSNFTHNPYVSEGALMELRDIRKKDEQLWKVYGLGKTGQLGELCIPRMEVVHRMPDQLARQGYGLDFGYRADPTALVHCGLQNGQEDLFARQLLYRRGMSLDDLDRAFVKLGIPKRTVPIYADGADARACDHLRRLGYRIIEVKKGPGSIEYGLSLVNQTNVHVTSDSEDIIQERKKYTYKKIKSGPRTGELTNDPIDAFNHGWDAIRYYCMETIKPRVIRRGKMRGFV